MGSVSSSIDNCIEKHIYYPPKIDKNQYKFLDTVRSLVFEVRTAKKEKVCGVYIRPRQNNFPHKYIVFSNGNNSDTLTLFEYLKNLSDDLNVGVISYDYIGYGVSEMKPPSEKLCYDSLEAIMNHLLEECYLSPKNIFLVGYSLGTGVVVNYISQKSWKTPVILISPYKSICTVVFDHLIVSPIDKFKSLKKIKNVVCPVKIFHGNADEVILVGHAKKIYNYLPNKSLKPVFFKGVGHNDILGKISKKHFDEVLNYQQ